VLIPVVTFQKNLEVACIELDHRVPVGKTFILGRNRIPRDNFLHGIVFAVAKDLALQERAGENVDISALLVSIMMIENKECSELHLILHFERDKITDCILVLKGFNVGCHHVNKIIMEVKDPMVLQSKKNRVCFGCSLCCLAQISLFHWCVA